MATSTRAARSEPPRLLYFCSQRFDAGERTIGGEAAIGGCSGNELGIDALAAESGFDQRLALLDLAGAGFSRSRQAGEVARGAREKLSGDEAGPGHEAQENNEE